MRDRDTPTGVKVEAERQCFAIRSALVAGLQSLGFLPLAARPLDAHLTHHVGDLASLADIRRETDRLAALEQAQAPPLLPAPAPAPSPTPDALKQEDPT